MEQLTSSSVNSIVQDIQASSNMETEYPFSGDSFQVGDALDLLIRGVSMEKNNAPCGMELQINCDQVFTGMGFDE